MLRMDQTPPPPKTPTKSCWRSSPGMSMTSWWGDPDGGQGPRFRGRDPRGRPRHRLAALAQGFRAYETVFSLITQVGGGAPAGRKTRLRHHPDHRPRQPRPQPRRRADYDAFFRSRRSPTASWASTRPSAGSASWASPARREIEVARAAARFSALLGPSGPQQPDLPPPGAWPHPRQHRKDQRELPLQAHHQGAAPTNASATLSARPSASTSRKSCPARPPWWWICILTVIFDKIIWRYTSWLSATL